MTISQVEPLSRLTSTVCSTISNTIAHWSFYIPTHFSMSKRRRTRWKGVPVIYYGDDIYTVNHTHFIYIYTEALYCSRIRMLSWSECTVCNCKTDSLTGVAVLQI